MGLGFNISQSVPLTNIFLNTLLKNLTTNTGLLKTTLKLGLPCDFLQCWYGDMC